MTKSYFWAMANIWVLQRCDQSGEADRDMQLHAERSRFETVKYIAL